MNQGIPTIGIGVLGCGGFGLFALQQFMQVPGVKLIGIAGTHREAAIAAARRFDAVHLESEEALVNHPDVDLIYIATPPFLHYQQALMALRAGKHVICEKPLAMTMPQADEMTRVASEKNRLMVTNLMQRYNPLFEKVRTLCAEKILGEPLHGFFENYASDEGLPAEHWFWDRTKSGGLFIEHGVHFFDVFSGWLGDGQVVAAQVTKRPGNPLIEESANCTVRYGEAVTVNFYHGFTQSGRMDRQEWRLLFERGEITLHEWVPTRLVMNGLIDEAQTKRLMEIFDGARLNVTAGYGGNERATKARHKSHDVYQLINLNYQSEQPKSHLYGNLLRDMFTDQVAWLRDPSHQRVITEVNGYQSLQMAETADQLARA